jgi:hypothetical protein
LEAILSKNTLGPLEIKFRRHFIKKIARSLHKAFFAVVNGGRGVDAWRISTQFLISMS